MAIDDNRQSVPLLKNRRLLAELPWRQRYQQLLRESAENQARAHGLAQAAMLQQEADRREISRELHDEIAQILTGINLQLTILVREASRSEKALRDRILATQSMVQKSVETIHRFARELRPLILDDLGLGAALRAYVREFTRLYGVPVAIDLGATGRLSDINKTVLFRVAQEALTNVGKHARATHAKLELKRSASKIVLVVRDNGCSFRVPPKPNSIHRRLGLIGMQERVRMANGTLIITSNKTSGTTITASLPTGR